MSPSVLLFSCLSLSFSFPRRSERSCQSGGLTRVLKELSALRVKLVSTFAGALTKPPMLENRGQCKQTIGHCPSLPSSPGICARASTTRPFMARQFSFLFLWVVIAFFVIPALEFTGITDSIGGEGSLRQKWSVGTMELCNGACEAACAARGQCCGLVLWPGRLARLASGCCNATRLE